jgi:N-methylhydantoinase A
LKENNMRLGIDVGGTFTDLVLINDQTGKFYYTKTLTTPESLSDGVIIGIEKILTLAGIEMSSVEYIVHGTTIGTNTMIERSGARAGLITTRGFRDVLEIARIERPDGGLYDMTVDLPDPLIPRYLRLEVDERIGAQGEVVKELDGESVRSVIEQFREQNVDALAVCLLFSFRNPEHERRVLELCNEFLPDVPTTVSSDIAPEFREFERTSTTVINAYLLPRTKSYVDRLQSRLENEYGASDLRIMQASGGSMTAEVAKTHAVNMVNSGPAGGALATALFGSLAGEKRVIGVDMGGTSFDVSLIVDGAPRIKSEGEIEGYPVKIPLMDVEGIGAGGGSIAWLDVGNALNIGPKSAGADPGPACYGRGGSEPTVTDANLILGRLNPDYFLGAEMPLHLEPARKAIESHIAQPLGISTEEAAAGILRVVNANMVRGISVNSIQKGFDVRDFTLLAFGGAGPLHAIELAEELGMKKVIIPPYCSVFSAFGAVASDVRHDLVRTVALSQKHLDPETLNHDFSAMENSAMEQLKGENVPDERIDLMRSADLRYEGQSYELNIPVTGKGDLNADSIDQLIHDFHFAHERIYAYSDPNEPIEVVSLRLAAIGRVPEIELAKEGTLQEGVPAEKSQRSVYFFGKGFLTSKIYERDNLRSGQSIKGPCLIEETTSTTVIPPGWAGSIDKIGNLILINALDERATDPEPPLEVQAETYSGKDDQR